MYATAPEKECSQCVGSAAFLRVFLSPQSSSHACRWPGMLRSDCQTVWCDGSSCICSCLLLLCAGCLCSLFLFFLSAQGLSSVLLFLLLCSCEGGGLSLRFTRTRRARSRCVQQQHRRLVYTQPNSGFDNHQPMPLWCLSFLVMLSASCARAYVLPVGLSVAPQGAPCELRQGVWCPVLGSALQSCSSQ